MRHGQPFGRAINDTKPTVLIVEDHAIVRQGCRELLERAGLTVIWEGADGRDAYQQFTVLKPHVVVVDLSIEGTSGLETIRRMRHHSPSARIIVFSMHDDASLATRALNAGAGAYVTKTSAPEQLINAVRHALQGLTYLSNDIAQVLALSSVTNEENPLATLSDKEFDVFRLLVDGHNSAQIATMMNMSTKSASNYVGKIKAKLGVSSIADLVRVAINCGLTKQNVQP